jgi:hypothetical protein
VRTNNIISSFALAFAAVSAVVVLGADSARAAGGAPVKQVIVSHLGWEVDATTKGPVCTVESKDVCQPGKASSEPGGFEFTESVAGGLAAEGNVYVADAGNNRVQEFNAKGEFVLMFGKHVNATTGGNICTEEEIATKAVKCQAGEAGGEAGALIRPTAIATDPSNGNLYVIEAAPANTRVDEYTPTGQFVWMVGKEVNQATKGDLCTQKEQCKAGVYPGIGATVTEHGAFVNPLVVAGGPNHVLYVGDEHRVQEFDEEGNWIGEIREPLEQISSEVQSTVSRLGVDPGGDVYLVYEVHNENRTILEFDPTGKEIDEFAGPPRRYIIALAIDPTGRLAVVENEAGALLGLLYQVEGEHLRLITSFAAQGDEGIAFDRQGTAHLYAAATNEVIVYKPVSVGELTIGPSRCGPGAEQETNVTLDCELSATVDPWGVEGTKVWFQWGFTEAFGQETEKKSVPVTGPEGTEEPPVIVGATVTGMRPNERIYDQLVGEDQNVVPPEFLTSAVAQLDTPSVPPRIVGSPSALFVRTSSVDLFEELNPENTQTTYEFQYAPADVCAKLEGCAETAHTKALTSNVYGKIGAMLEARGLQPATEYIYRLDAVNQSNPPQLAVNQSGGPDLPEGRFTTAPATAPTAVTGPVATVGQTTATITGAVDPDGHEATYSFELGVYSGSDTQYATVASGAAGADAAPVNEALSLMDLQPSTMYAYRIAIKSGYIDNESHILQGAPQTFTTLPLVSLLQAPQVPQMLATPIIRRPTSPSPSFKCRKGFRLIRGHHCVRVKRHKRKHR